MFKTLDSFQVEECPQTHASHVQAFMEEVKFSNCLAGSIPGCQHWAELSSRTMYSPCVLMHQARLISHVGANKAAFKWAIRLKASFMQDFCLGIFLWECLKKRKEHDFSLLQKANPLKSAIGVGYSPSGEPCSGYTRGEHCSVMPFLWNSWDVVFSLTLHTGTLTPLLHPGVCARRAKQTPLWLDIGQKFCLCHTEEFWFV